ncbi:MAG TPA: FAD-dependent monooxygenase [Microlunatus sp.]|nr:FAD-dependent monooxygenase [Microlunatus sp.]
MSDVVIVGGGPTGLMLAGELALAGVDVLILERRTTAELTGTRARGFHARTIEIFDQRGIADRFLDRGQIVQLMSFAGTPLPISTLPSRHPYTLGLSQSHVEQILRGWVEELGVPIRHGVDVTGFTQDDAGVTVHLSGGDEHRATFLVGADGGRSVIRRAAGIDFVGAEATRSYLIGEVEVSDDPPPGLRQDAIGIHGVNLTGQGRTAGFIVTEVPSGPTTGATVIEPTPGEPTLVELSSALTAVYGTDFGVHDPVWISRFTDAARQATAYRRGRVLIAGDAAHIHPPTGGQGIGLGVQDAVNLGWKLALVVRQTASEVLLDSYQAERHPVTARVIKNVMTQALLQRSDARTDALRDTFGELLTFDAPRTQLAGLLTGLDVAYDLGGAHPLVGRRMPDLDLITADGPQRAFELLHAAKPVLLEFGEPGGRDITGWADRIRRVEAKVSGPWELPVIGTVSAPSAVLIRPDGHVAWVGDGPPTGLREALVTWFGAPS